MKDDATKKTNQSDKTDRAADKLEDLPQKPVSERDAQSVKGGLARRGGDDNPVES